MKSKRFLRNLTRPALLFSLLALTLTLIGCQAEIEPSYKGQEIPLHIQKICKEEYGLDVVVKRIGATLWIYAPVSKLLHEKFGVEKDKVFAEEVKEKLINILTSIGRVILSADKAPDFYCLFISDVEAGIDYGLIGYVLDMKKHYAGFIPYTEADKRYVVKFGVNPDGIGDRAGAHLKVYDIKLADFLAEQIAQRIGVKFQSEDWKNFFTVDSVQGVYKGGTFIFNYAIKPTPLFQGGIDVRKEILTIAAYCLRTYEFDGFSGISLNDLVSGNQTIIGRAALEQIKVF
jgi:hypothetical protein